MNYFITATQDGICAEYKQKGYWLNNIFMKNQYFEENVWKYCRELLAEKHNLEDEDDPTADYLDNTVDHIILL